MEPTTNIYSDVTLPINEQSIVGHVALHGEMIAKEIPLAVRITALADVFDALCSRRSYKAEWNDEKIVDLISGESGKHFDQEVVDAFLDIFDVIVAIRDKFKEKGEREIEGAIETKVEQHS